MIKYNMNKHSGPLFKKSNVSPPPPDDKFFELLHYTPKTISIVLRSRGKKKYRLCQLVSFVTVFPTFAAKRPDYRGDARCWQPLKERTLNIPLFKEDFCSNIQGKQGGKLFGKSWKKISHQNEVETRLVQVMIVLRSIRECIDRFGKVVFDANVYESKRVKVTKCRSIPQIVIRFD